MCFMTWHSRVEAEYYSKKFTEYYESFCQIEYTGVNVGGILELETPLQFLRSITELKKKN